MALERLKIELSNKMPWGKVTDLDTGEELNNITAINVTADVNARPVITVTLEITDVVIETDGTVSPQLVVNQIIRNRYP